MVSYTFHGQAAAHDLSYSGSQHRIAIKNIEWFCSCGTNFVWNYMIKTKELLANEDLPETSRYGCTALVVAVKLAWVVVKRPT